MTEQSTDTNPRIARKILAFIERWPKVSLLLSALAVGASLPGLGMLPVDLTHRAMLAPDHTLIQELDQFERRFGNDDSVVIAVHHPDGIFRPESIVLLHEMTDAMWQVTDVIRVDSLTNFNIVQAVGDDLIVEGLLPPTAELTDAFLQERKTIALGHDTLPGYLVSADGRTAVMYGAIRPGFETPPPEINIVKDVRKMVEHFGDRGHEIHVLGNPANAVAFQESMVGDLSLLVPIVSALTLVLLYLLLRTVVGVILPILVVIVAVVATMGIAGWVGVVVTNLTSILPQILLAIGIAASVHILVAFLRAMERGMNQHDAASYALAKNFVPTFLTSISTSIGFASFATATVKVIGYLGIMGAIGTLITWLAAYFVLGPLMYLVPVRRAPKPDKHLARRAGFVTRVNDTLFRRRRGIIAVSLLLSITSIALGSMNEVNSDPVTYLTEDVPMRQSINWFEDAVGGIRTVEAWIDSGEDEGVKDPEFLRAVEALQTWLEEKPYVTETVSILNVIKEMNRALNGGDDAAYRLPDDRETIGQELFLYSMSLPQGMDINNQISSRNDQIRMTIIWTLAHSAEMIRVADEIKAKGRSLGLDVVITGKQWIFQSINPLVVNSFIISICAAVFLISLLLIVVFRSVKLGLLAMGPNLVPLFFGAAVLYVIGQPLDMGTTMVFAVCLGIAVDDTIHILANFNRSFQSGMSARDSVREVLAETSPALMTTTAILVTAFGVFIFATFIPNLYFGVLTAIILSAALIADLTFLPALLYYQDKDDPAD